VLKKYKGIVILHDYVLHHFFSGYWLNKKQNSLGYIKEMELNYGEKGRELAQEILANKRKPVWETEEVIDFPLNLSVLKASEGIIVHSEFVKKKTQSLVEIPIKKLNHPYFNIAPERRSSTTLNSKRFRLFFLGEVGLNRGIDKIIEIIGNDEILKSRFSLTIVGKDTTPSAIEAKKHAEIFGLTKIINFLGRRQEFEELLEAPDICLGLRYPTRGETSGAVIRYLSAGKPILVSKVGWYDELPDEIVIKIDPGKEIDEVAFVLHDFLKEPEKYKAIGKKAREFVKKNFSLDDFVQGLLKFISFVNKRKALDSLIDKVSSELISMNLTNDQPMLDKLSKELYSMFS
jgi:glycosyltransferase involved in cell wall biosynthesis